MGNSGTFFTECFLLTGMAKKIIKTESMSNVEQDWVLIMTTYLHNLVKKPDDSLVRVKYLLGRFCTFPSHGAFSVFSGISLRETGE